MYVKSFFKPAARGINVREKRWGGIIGVSVITCNSSIIFCPVTRCEAVLCLLASNQSPWLSKFEAVQNEVRVDDKTRSDPVDVNAAIEAKFNEGEKSLDIAYVCQNSQCATSGRSARVFNCLHLCGDLESQNLRWRLTH